MTSVEAKQLMRAVPLGAIKDAKADRRFWSKVDRKSGDCWIWTGSTDGRGYGNFWLSDQNRNAKAHRWSFVRHGGELTNERPFVLHACDTPACVRPSHLRAGTNAENMAERNLKGRQARLAGEGNGRSRVTEENVLEIRRLRDAGVPLRVVAAQFKIAIPTVHNIGRRERWVHVAEAVQ